MRVKDFALCIVSNVHNAERVVSRTQLEFGSKNLHHTPSLRISSILRHLFRKTASIRLRKSII